MKTLPAERNRIRARNNGHGTGTMVWLMTYISINKRLIESVVILQKNLVTGYDVTK